MYRLIGLGHIFGEFFANSSGHPGLRSEWTLSFRRCVSVCTRTYVCMYSLTNLIRVHQPKTFTSLKRRLLKRPYLHTSSVTRLGETLPFGKKTCPSFFHIKGLNMGHCQLLSRGKFPYISNTGQYERHVGYFLNFLEKYFAVWEKNLALIHIKRTKF